LSNLSSTCWLTPSSRELLLQPEILVPRHKLNALQHRSPLRFHLRWADRALFILLILAVPNTMSVTLPSAEHALPPVHHYHDGVLVALDILEGRRYRLMPPSCPTNVSRRTGRASGPLPQLASSAVPEAEALLPAD